MKNTRAYYLVFSMLAKAKKIGQVLALKLCLDVRYVMIWLEDFLLLQQKKLVSMLLLQKYYGYFKAALICNISLTIMLIIGLPTMKPQVETTELLVRYMVINGEISMGLINCTIYYLTLRRPHIQEDSWLMLGILLISTTWHCLLVTMVFKSI